MDYLQLYMCIGLFYGVGSFCWKVWKQHDKLLAEWIRVEAYCGKYTQYVFYCIVLSGILVKIAAWPYPVLQSIMTFFIEEKK